MRCNVRGWTETVDRGIGSGWDWSGSSVVMTDLAAPLPLCPSWTVACVGAVRNGAETVTATFCTTRDKKNQHCEELCSTVLRFIRDTYVLFLPSLPLSPLQRPALPAHKQKHTALCSSSARRPC